MEALHSQHFKLKAMILHFSKISSLTVVSDGSPFSRILYLKKNGSQVNYTRISVKFSLDKRIIKFENWIGLLISFSELEKYFHILH